MRRMKVAHAQYLFFAFKTYFFAWLKRRLAIKTMFIGVTGSVGKTTTKDICVSMLSEFASCGQTRASYNRHLSIAKELASMSLKKRYFVVEVSASKPGFLDRSLWLSRPSVGVLTTIGRDHYKAFKSTESIAQEKEKLIQKLPRHGVAVLNLDDPHVKEIGERWPHRKVWVGRTKGADIRLIEAHSRWPETLTLVIEYKGETYPIRTKLHGEHLALSVLCSLGVAVALGLNLNKAILGISKVEPSEGRMQIVEGEDGVTFVRDDWKAPEWALHAPMKFLKEAYAKRKVAIIGSISDFSADSSSKYKQIARRFMEVADLTVFVGPNSHRAVRARKHPEDQSLMGFEHTLEAAHYLRRELRAGDLVLLKGSAKADHLVRLLYDRYKSVQCWEDRCGLNQFCGSCTRLYELSAQNERYAQSQLMAAETVSNFGSMWGTPEGKPTVIVGLGNSGVRYEGTPHNIGYEVLDKLASQLGISWMECSDGLMAKGNISSSSPVLLFKAAGKMNVSGRAVRSFLMQQKGHPEKCIIVHDEMDLKIGDARFKTGGGAAGHNGVKSVLTALGAQNIARVRVGVNVPEEQSRAKDRVLTVFSIESRKHLEEGVTKAVKLVAEALLQFDETSSEKSSDIASKY